MNTEKIQEMIINHEGYRRHPYLCTAGKSTIGIGRNLTDKGISREEAMYLLDNDIRECTADLLAIFPGQFDSFPENVKMVLLDMRFQMGPGGFRLFKNMIAAVKKQDWPGMVVQMWNSKWYRQTNNRALELIGMVESV